MNTALLALLALFVAVVALWPVVWVAAIIRLLLSRQWQRLGRLALLLPLWTVAASIGAVKFGLLFASKDAANFSPPLVIAATSIGIAMCFAVVAWLLLVRSFRLDQAQPASGKPR